MLNDKIKKMGLLKISSLFIAGFAAFIVLMLSVITPTNVFGVSSVTVRGNVNTIVSGPKLMPVANKSVTVVCQGNTQTVTTNSSGLYTATYTGTSCDSFSPVSARSTYNGSIITRQVWVSSEGRATIDLNF